MTIFHTIKYPLSDPPTVEELRAFPDILYGKVIHLASSKHINNTYHPPYIVANVLYNMKNNFNESYIEFMNDIRQRLYEYDEPLT